MSELLRIGGVDGRPKAPAPETLTLRFSDAAVHELDALKSHYPEVKACILPALWIAQREYGGNLVPEALAEVAFRLNRSYAEIEGVATFYSMYNVVHKAGKHKIEVCTCLSCHLCGAYGIYEHLKAKLGIGHGETTEDGMFTLEEVECLDACDRAPVLQVGDRYVGPVDEAAVDRLLAELRANPQSTVVQLADEIVQTHLAQHERAR
ncbi:MAG: NAD(P)H-dependent oxidoreductase subunit E [Fimbriimonadaceae bacterium]|nr:NAD(P)H-dependent oxidoreductase subunit E [Fimbriimonadaceae bacterium]